MITTVDGVIKKPGDTAYMISLHFVPGVVYYYCLPIVIDEEDGVFVDVKYYDSEALCIEQCKLLNKDKISTMALYYCEKHKLKYDVFFCTECCKEIHQCCIDNNLEKNR